MWARSSNRCMFQLGVLLHRFQNFKHSQILNRPLPRCVLTSGVWPVPRNPVTLTFDLLHSPKPFPGCQPPSQSVLIPGLLTAVRGRVLPGEVQVPVCFSPGSEGSGPDSSAVLKQLTDRLRRVRPLTDSSWPASRPPPISPCVDR